MTKLDYFRLLPILIFAFYIALIPHHNSPYPVHIDEWVHIAYSNEIIDTGSTTITGPFLGEKILDPSSNLETGFHVLLGLTQQITGLSWPVLIRLFPCLVFMLVVLAVFISVRREGFGWEAALMTCFIPTTVGILGPGFTVPVALGIMFIPLSLFMAFNITDKRTYLLLFIFTCFLLSIHSPSAICLVIILTPYIIINLKGNFRHSLGMALAVLIPFLIPFPWVFDLLLPTARSLLVEQPVSQYVQLPRIVADYGYIPVILALLGTFYMVMKNTKKSYGLASGLLLILLMLGIYYSWHYGILIVYMRGITFAMLMMSIVAGAGLMCIKKLRLPESLSVNRFVSLAGANIGVSICLVIITIMMVLYIPARQNTPYYYMIDSKDYQSFLWIQRNIGNNYDKAVLDPWKATAFVATTGKHVYTRIHMAPFEPDSKAYSFLDNKCQDTSFLQDNGILMVYSRLPCENNRLIKIYEDTYLFQ